ncbi:hydrogenase [Candidatus Woesearchaeota archaeon]|nr:MAG: hydrogenase [Candidatus Woesearchaeota archaeon]
MNKFNLIWMQGQTCDGDSMSVINSTEPDFLAFLERSKINLLYHPTLSPEFGKEAQDLFEKCLSGEIPVHIFVFEGSIPTKKGFGDFFEGKDVRKMVENFASKAMLTIAVGTCASFGGVPASKNNETGSVGLQWLNYEKGGFLGKDFTSEVGLPVINIPGCPTHPDWVIGTLQSFRMGRAIHLDKYNRPLDFFSEKVHRGCKHCEYLESGLWAKDFTELGCLAASLGCKGRTTNADCNIRLWNGVSTCTRSGAPCIGCCDPGFPDNMEPFNKETLDLPQDLLKELQERNNILRGDSK